MRVTVCDGKIHRARLTRTDLNYEGSILIDADLVKAAGFSERQMVRINNVSRKCIPWDTYIVLGKPGSGEIVLNGPPAHHFKKGDIVIILAYGSLKKKKVKRHRLKVVFVNKKNEITKVEKK